MPKVVLFNKPFGVLSQFTDKEGRLTLAHYIPDTDVRPAGRLDYDSEGLLILSDHGGLLQRITHPRHKLSKVYWVQVEGIPNADALHQLQAGVPLRDGITAPAKVRVIAEPQVWPRDPPIRHRLSVPTTWLELTITEGRNRQVRRMTAAVGLPTLRLIRYAIGKWRLGDLRPGQYRCERIPMPEAARVASPASPRRRQSATARHLNTRLTRRSKTSK